jgi:hypothetical protein
MINHWTEMDGVFLGEEARKMTNPFESKPVMFRVQKFRLIPQRGVFGSTGPDGEGPLSTNHGVDHHTIAPVVASLAEHTTCQSWQVWREYVDIFGSLVLEFMALIQLSHNPGHYGIVMTCTGSSSADKNLQETTKIRSPLAGFVYFFPLIISGIHSFIMIHP